MLLAVVLVDGGEYLARSQLQTAGGGCWPNGWRGRNRQMEVDRDVGCAGAGEGKARAELCQRLEGSPLLSVACQPNLQVWDEALGEW